MKSQYLGNKILSENYRKIQITLKALLRALAPSFSNLFLPEMKTFKANGVPAAELDL